jgi:hypothetical protein
MGLWQGSLPLSQNFAFSNVLAAVPAAAEVAPALPPQVKKAANALFDVPRGVNAQMLEDALKKCIEGVTGPAASAVTDYVLKKLKKNGGLPPDAQQGAFQGAVVHKLFSTAALPAGLTDSAKTQCVSSGAKRIAVYLLMRTARKTSTDTAAIVSRLLTELAAGPWWGSDLVQGIIETTASFELGHRPRYKDLVTTTLYKIDRDLRCPPNFRREVSCTPRDKGTNVRNRSGRKPGEEWVPNRDHPLLRHLPPQEDRRQRSPLKDEFAKLWYRKF